MKKTYTLIAIAASMSFAAKIGVLVNQGSCPSGHYPTIIKLDAEDSDNATKYSGDDKKPIGISGKSLVEFSYCVFDYDKLHKMAYDYVVLRMDDKCPEGSKAFARRHDTEDSNNANSPKGSFLVSPSDIGDNAKIEYCFVPKETDPKKIKYPYPFQKSYGVFANPSSSSSIVRNQVKIDDEDSGNGNDWDWRDIKDDATKNRIKNIVEGGDNTIYHTIKWVGSTNNLPAMSETWKTTVGVLRVNNSASCQRTFKITLDTEDSGSSGYDDGSNEYAGITIPNDLSSVTFDFCVVDGTNIPKARYDYVVLRTSKYCPAGTYPFARHHDSEDSNNKNFPKYSPIVWPSKITDNANLEFCLVPGQSNGVKYPFSASQGIFAANPKMNNLVYGRVEVEDQYDGRCAKYEDIEIPSPSAPDGSGVDRTSVCVEWVNDNDNSWEYYGASKNIKTRIHNIVNGDGETYYRVLHWNGKSLSKSAEAVVEAPAVGEIAPVAAVSVLPEIKGFDHSAVTVELKSAGKVVVSIMNIRGDVVATVSQENMQPGIHMVKWNSGSVPNGRYVVAVKQNGKFTAKNVILK